MRAFKIKLSVEWADRDVETDATDVEVTELGVEAWASYQPDQLALAVMLALPELTQELTGHLTERTGERGIKDQVLTYMRRAAAEGDARAASRLHQLAELDPTVGAAPASETTGNAPSVEELTAMFDAPAAEQPRHFTVDGSGETTES